MKEEICQEVAYPPVANENLDVHSDFLSQLKGCALSTPKADLTIHSEDAYRGMTSRSAQQQTRKSDEICRAADKIDDDDALIKHLSRQKIHRKGVSAAKRLRLLSNRHSDEDEVSPVAPETLEWKHLEDDPDSRRRRR